jgi:hypothetical protein
MSVATSEGWSQPISVIGLVIVLELITNNLVEPIVFGRTIGVSPTALLISAAFWLFLWGPIGLILSAPFAVVLVVIGKNIPRLRFLDLLLGDQAALSADVGLYQRLLVQDDHQRLNLIHNQLLNQSAEVSYDELLIPALKYSKRDFLLGLLTEEERDDIVDVIEKAITKEPEASSSAPAAAKDESLKKKKELSADQVTVLGCSAEGETDRLALLMLQGVLDPARWNLEFVAEEILTSELVRHVAEHPPAAVCIAALPPRGLAQARYLCKRLRAVNPGLPLIVGRWGQKRMRPRDRERLREAGATVVTLSLAETVQWLQSHRPIFDQPRPLKNVAPSDVSENPAPIST